jgi:hypothetical protein
MIGDNSDPDIDGDGVANAEDAFPLDASESLDTDGDMIGNNADLDDDGDTLSDESELANGTDPLKADTDGDTVNDDTDAYPLDANRSKLGTVALKGAVSVFPDSLANNSGSSLNPTRINTLDYQAKFSINNFKGRKFGAVRSLNDDVPTTITRDDMVPSKALVSIFLLSDVDFKEPIATVPTDENGNYSIRAENVVEYLVLKGKVAETATDEEIMVAFKALGKVQVRALVVKEDDSGTQSAMAIQSIADPSNVDESGEPVPVVVDPIVHRVVKSVVSKIKDAINNLTSLGIS